MASPTPVAGVRTGIWGGRGIRLEVTSSGGRVEYDCAHGAIAQQLNADRDGRFEMTGTHVRERPGPVRENEVLPVERAHYVGRVDASTMSLTVLLPDTDETVGRFTLSHGRQGLLRKCL